MQYNKVQDELNPRSTWRRIKDMVGIEDKNKGVSNDLRLSSNVMERIHWPGSDHQRS